MKFINEEQREKLTNAFKILSEVFAEVTMEHEDYTIIKTSKFYLERAIKYKEKYY
jgi:hypothetical protein